MRIVGETLKGYELKQFNDAFMRYIPDTPIQSVTTLQPKQDAAYSHFQSVTNTHDVTLSKPLKPKQDGACNVVTVQIPLTGESEGKVSSVREYDI